LWKFDSFFYWCESYKKVWDNVSINIWGFEKHTGWFIHGKCNNYSQENNSITSRWDWDNTRVIWVR
jgi:hypothetical protein